MMKNFFTLFVTFSVIFASAQKHFGSVIIDSKLVIEGENLTLNGAGVREKMFMDIYIGALYVTKKVNDGIAVSVANEPMAVKLHIVSGLISSDGLIAAMNEGFDRATGGNTLPIKNKIDKFKSFLRDKVNKKDVYILAYVPNEGVSVYKNGVKKGIIEGLDFKRALFGIWLGKKPVDNDLKANLLGV